jgi:hypothetical protein
VDVQVASTVRHEWSLDDGRRLFVGRLAGMDEQLQGLLTAWWGKPHPTNSIHGDFCMRMFGSAKSDDSEISGKLYLKTIVLAALSVSTAAFGADWEMRVTDNAAMEISHSQVPIVKADYCFWGAKWNYAGVKAQMGESQGSDRTFPATSRRSV